MRSDRLGEGHEISGAAVRSLDVSDGEMLGFWRWNLGALGYFFVGAEVVGEKGGKGR